MANYWQQLLAVRGLLYMSFVASLVPNFREVEALCAIQNSRQGEQLLSQVLSPMPPAAPPLSSLALPGTAGSSSSSRAAVISPLLRQALMAAYNGSQQAAVAASLDKRWPIVLVQGPPGTGKTSAIMGIVSALLAAGSSGSSTQPDADSSKPAGAGRKQKPPSKAGTGAAATAAATAADAAATAAAAAASRGRSAAGALAQPAIRVGVVPPVRVLVCAQSNAAIDELMTRLADSGIWGSNGAKRAPAMVRLGRSDATAPSVRSLHLDALTDGYLQHEQLDRLAKARQRQVEAGGVAGEAAAAAAAAASEHEDAVQARVRRIRDKLQQVERQLADLAAAKAKGVKQGVSAAVDGRSEAAAAEEQQQPPDGKHGRTEVGLAAAVADAKPRKRQRMSDGSAATTSVAHVPGSSSGSDMDVSDSEGAAAVHRGQGQQQHFVQEDIRQQAVGSGRGIGNEHDGNRHTGRGGGGDGTGMTA
ncbi:AAA domain-containing protein [Scenedesmus sp. NREL 46B-D3]|nr:AAA domain-containing protein [Scenedesmus sp. NREL 46B-D3]